jgi:hypothetical protein
MSSEPEGKPFNLMEINFEVSEPEYIVVVDLSIVIVLQQLVFMTRLLFIKSELDDVIPP